MDQNQILQRIHQKLSSLGEAKLNLESQLAKAREEADSLFRINKELQHQIDELTEKNLSLSKANTLKAAENEPLRQVTKQRISELVREIDDCIALLNH